MTKAKIPDHVVLSEVLHTRFMTPFMTPKLKEFFQECRDQYESSGVKVCVDIKHCKFNPDNYREVCIFCDYIDFVDSYDPIVDSMLVHNARVSTVRRLESEGKIMIESIPAEFDPAGMLQYVQNPNYSKVYRLKGFRELNGRSPDVSILIAMAIGYLHPSISIDLSAQAEAYFRMFKKFWSYSGLVKRDSYNLLWQGNILKIDVVKVNKMGEHIFRIPGVGEITESILNQNFQVIPYEFGTSKNLEDDPELCDVFSDVADALQKLMTSKKKKKKLTSELTVIEGS